MNLVQRGLRWRLAPPGTTLPPSRAETVATVALIRVPPKRNSQVLLDRPRAKKAGVGEDADQGDRQQHRRQGRAARIVQVLQERVLDDGADHRVVRAAQNRLVNVVAQRRYER